MKKTLPVPTMVFVLALVLFFSLGGGLALAQHDKAGKSKHAPAQVAREMPAMSPEDRAAVAGMWQAHHDQMAPLRDQMWAKKLEYEALAANPNTKPGDIQPVIDSMVQLRAQMRAEREKFFGQMKDKGYGPEFWRGLAREFHRGDGPGMGGGMGMGMGSPNPCGMMGDRDGHYGYGRHHRAFDDFE